MFRTWTKRRGFALAIAAVLTACNGGSGDPDVAADHHVPDVALMPDATDTYSAPDDVTADGSNVVDSGNSMIDAMSDPDVSTNPDANTSEPGGACDHSIRLLPGETRPFDTTPSAGIVATACRPSSAPQRFYAFDIPPNARAIIRVTPADPLSAVVRVYPNCDLTMCITDEESNEPGAAVELVVDNRNDVVLHKTITVSGLASNRGGAYSILATLESLGSTPTDAGSGGTDASSDPDSGTVGMDAASDATSIIDSGSGSDVATGSDTATGSDAATGPACTLATERALTLPSDAFDGTLDGANRIPSTRCVSSATGEDIFPLHLDARLGVTLVLDNRYGVLSIRSRCSDALTELGCHATAADTDARVTSLTRVLDPGDYYVIVDGFASTQMTTANYHLTLTSFAPPPESSCATAAEIAGTSVTGNTGFGGAPNTTCYPLPGQQAFYRVTIPPHQRVSLTLGRSATRTSSAIRVMDGCGASQCLTYGRIPGGDQGTTSVVADNPGDAPRTVFVGVSSLAAYDASFTIFPRFWPLAPYASNASCASATVLTDGIDLTNEDLATASSRVECSADLYTGNSLFYRVTIPPGRLFSFVADPDLFAADLMLRTLDSCGATTCNPIRNAGEGATEEVMHVMNDGTAPRDLVIAVGGVRPNQSQPFDVRASIRVPAANIACHAPQAVTSPIDAHGLDFATAWSSDRAAGINPDAPAFYYSVDLESDDSLVVEAEPTGPTTPRLMLFSDCTSGFVPGQLVRTAPDGTASLVYSNHTGARQSLLLAVYAARQQVSGTFDLRISTQPPPPNGTCASAATVTDGDDMRDQDLLFAREAPPVCGLGTTGNAFFYRASVPAGQELTVMATGEHGMWDPYIELFDSCGATSCIAANNRDAAFRSEVLHWTNTGSTTRNVMFAVGGTTSDARLRVSVRIQPPPFTVTTIAASCDTMPANSVHLTMFDAVGPNALPFAFTYFGSTVTSFDALSYGYIKFSPSTIDGPGSLVTPTAFPSMDYYNNILAPFWGWTAAAGDGSSDILVGTLGTAPNRHVTVEWRNWTRSHSTCPSCPATDPGDRVTFQAKLFEGSNRIELHYCAMNAVLFPGWTSGAEASIGGENGSGNLGVEIGYLRAGTTSTGVGYRLVPNL